MMRAGASDWLDPEKTIGRGGELRRRRSWKHMQAAWKEAMEGRFWFKVASFLWGGTGAALLEWRENTRG